MKKNHILTPMELLKLHYQALELQEDRIELLNRRIEDLEQVMTIDYGQQKDLNDLHHSIGTSILGGKESKAYENGALKNHIFHKIWRDYKEHFNIASYKDTSSGCFKEAVDFIKSWQPEREVLKEINCLNEK